MKLKFQNSDCKRAGWALTICLSLSLALAGGCSKKATAPTPPSVDELVANGWSSFESGYFSNALNYFNQALGQNSSHVDALNGKGWCLGILGDRAGALAAFRSGLSAAPANNSLRAGLAFVYAAMDSSQQAAQADSLTLAADSLWALGHRYVMSYDLLMDWRDLRILLAEELYCLGRFSEALAQVKKLNPSFSIGSDFTQVSNQTALLIEIERLSMLYK